MSWRNGAQLFAEIWPSIRTRVPDARQRREFLDALLPVFLDCDLDPETIVDVHPEIRQALIRLGVEVPAAASQEDDVAACVRQLGDDEGSARLAAAEAIEYFVHQSDNPAKPASVALQALAKALDDTESKVRRMAARSIVELTFAGFPLTPRVRKQLERFASDSDDLVKKRINQALKRQSAKRAK